MTCYAALAQVYDRLVQGVDFDGWADYVEQILARFHVDAVNVADLACGTGNTALPLLARGYRVTGVDISRDMLARAGEKARRLGLDLVLKQADMRLFTLPGPVDLVTCFHDGLNYLADATELAQTFARVRLALRPGGLFIFDLNALEWLAACGGGEQETVFTTPDYGLTWSTRYDSRRRCWEISLRGWIMQDGDKVLFAETHREQAFPPREVGAALEAAGLSPLALFHPFTLEPAGPDSRRHFYVAGRP
ncbi:MAG: class I SAM-dependent methyltransferase [Peptococcaceae bacterium]|jgi:SAM-dependent methyltransferase|nr:class I SAM-dependent methyltransferase [Peptococcaceae bacterium]